MYAAVAPPLATMGLASPAPSSAVRRKELFSPFASLYHYYSQQRGNVTFTVFRARYLFTKKKQKSRLRLFIIEQLSHALLRDATLSQTEMRERASEREKRRERCSTHSYKSRFTVTYNHRVRSNSTVSAPTINKIQKENKRKKKQY